MILHFATTESASGVAAFGVNIKALIFQLVTFLIVLWILNKYAIKKIVVVLDKRREELELSLKNAEEAKQLLADADSKSDELIAEARKQADGIMSTANTEATELIKVIEQKADKKAERIIAEAREQLAHDVAAAKAMLKKDSAKLVAEATGVVLQEKLSSSNDAKLIQKSLEGAK